MTNDVPTTDKDGNPRPNPPASNPDIGAYENPLGAILKSILGDVNTDTHCNSTDALIVLSCDVGINVSQFCPMNCGDVNGDGFINSTDALIILSYDVGISVPFPVCEPGCPTDVTQCPGCNP